MICDTVVRDYAKQSAPKYTTQTLTDKPESELWSTARSMSQLNKIKNTLNITLIHFSLINEWIFWQTKYNICILLSILARESNRFERLNLLRHPHFEISCLL